MPSDKLDHSLDLSPTRAYVSPATGHIRDQRQQAQWPAPSPSIHSFRPAAACSPPLPEKQGSRGGPAGRVGSPGQRSRNVRSLGLGGGVGLRPRAGHGSNRCCAQHAFPAPELGLWSQPGPGIDPVRGPPTQEASPPLPRLPQRQCQTLQPRKFMPARPARRSAKGAEHRVSPHLPPGHVAVSSTTGSSTAASYHSPQPTGPAAGSPSAVTTQATPRLSSATARSATSRRTRTPPGLLTWPASASRAPLSFLTRRS